MKYVVFDKESGEYICGPLNRKDVLNYVQGLLEGDYYAQQLDIFEVIPVVLEAKVNLDVENGRFKTTVIKSQSLGRAEESNWR